MDRLNALYDALAGVQLFLLVFALFTHLDVFILHLIFIYQLKSLDWQKSLICRFECHGKEVNVRIFLFFRYSSQITSWPILQ